MWEVLVRTPRGSNSLRKFSHALATLLVACFGYIFLTAPSAHAVDATWEGEALQYEGNSYDRVPADDSFPDDVKDSPAIYRYVETNQTPNRVNFIYFYPGVDDAQSENEAVYVRYTLNPPNSYSNQENKQFITVTPVSDTPLPGADTDDGLVTDTCTIDGIGWIVCPLMYGISEGMDFIYEKIRGFLVVQPITTSVDNPIYRIWVYSRDIANVLFVIGFLVIIYSYLVGGGFNGYQIRKIIPRLAIAAVLINLSYILCAIAVDASNIAGYGINQLFENVRDEVLPGSSAGDEVPINWTSVTTAVLGGGAGATALALTLPGITAGAVAGGLWFLLAPFLVGGALLVVVTFFILAARQAIIVLLIAIAPLAFAAFILPNTEKWFEKWRSLFFTMLIMFPAFGAVFGGAQLAGETIIRTANGIELVILGLGVMVAPLAITPLLLKLGGGVLNRFGGIVNNAEKGAFDRFRNYNNDRRQEFLAAQNRNNATRVRNGEQLGRFRRAAYNQNYRKYNRGRLREANESYTNALYNDNDQGIETLVSRGRRRYANARGQAAPTPSYRLGSGEIADISHRSKLLEGYTHARHDEHWQHELQHSAPLRTMLTDTRLMEGRAKVMQGAMEAQDERTFQTALNTDAAYANLRNQKIQTTVDANTAEGIKGRLEAEGNLQFKQAFTGSSQAAKDLRANFNETTSLKKQASEIDSVLEKRAEAYWQRTSVADDDIRKIRLEAVEAGESATKYEQQWNKLIENIRAQGASAPGVINQDDRTIAGSIRQLGQDITVEKWAIEAAQRETQQAISGELKTNDALRAYAGGIGGVQAANRIYAKSKKDVVAAYMEDVDNSRSVLSDYTAKELVKLHVEGIDRNGKDQRAAGNTAIIDAALQEIALNKGNNWAFQKMRDRIADMGMIYDETTGHYYDLARDASGEVIRDAITEEAQKGNRITDADEIDRRRDVQQLFADAAKKSKLKVSNLSQTDLGNYESGLSHTTGKSAIIRDIITGKFDQEKIVSMDVDELQRMVQILRDPQVRSHIDSREPEALGKLLAQIDGAQRNKQLNGRIKDRERGIMNAIAGYIDPQEAGRNDVESVYYVDPKEDNARVPAGTPGAISRNALVKAPRDYDRNVQN